MSCYNLINSDQSLFSRSDSEREKWGNNVLLAGVLFLSPSHSLSFVYCGMKLGTLVN